PVDLNSFRCRLERQTPRLSQVKGWQGCAEQFHRRAEGRLAAIDRYLWSDEVSAYVDYDWKRRQPRDNLTAATLTPLFVRIASKTQAERVAAVVRERLLAPGGLSTTELSGTGAQWDRPNGWAPLQGMGVRALR